MTNAFISYAIAENEQYILNLLAQRIAEAGLSLVTSYNQGDWPDPQSTDEIRNSAVFIGLITKAGTIAKRNRVYSDFKQAHAVNRPAILLIEQGIRTLWEQHYHNTIFFNRYNIAHSIEEVKQRIHKSQLQPPQNTDAAAWLLAGVGILALLALLSSDKK